MDFLSTMKAKAKADKKVIVLPESYEIRNLEAAAECLRDELADIMLVGNKEKIMEICYNGTVRIVVPCMEVLCVRRFYWIRISAATLMIVLPWRTC